MKKSEIRVLWSFEIICPWCGQEFDLAEDDNDCIYCDPIFHGKAEELIGHVVVCPECGKKFSVSDVIL